MTARDVGRLTATTLIAAIAIACSAEHGSADATHGDTRSFVPEGLPNTELEGGEGGLTLSAFTLVQGENALEMYAAARNDGATPLCEAGLSVDFLDDSERLLGSAGVGLYSGGFYRIGDGSGVVITCVAPGEIALGGATAVLESALLDQIAHVRHAFPSFVLNEIEPVEGLRVSDVRAMTKGDGSVYTGVLHSALDADVENPRVSVFPVNRVGRPLGMGTSDVAATLPAGSSARFETTSVRERGEGHVALATIVR